MSRRDLYALALPVLAYLGLVAMMVRAVLRLDGGEFTYAVDDPYIHLAVARNLVENGVFCTSGAVHCSVSSSLLWPYLLAAVLAATSHVLWAPLVLNALGGVALIALFYAIARQGSGAAGAALLAAAGGAASLLPGMTLIGMEHVWHEAAVVGFAWLVVRGLAREPASPVRDALPPALLGLLATAIRLESLFVVLIGCALLAGRRRVGRALAIGLVSAVPLLVQAAQGIAHGEGFLPNSIVVKAVVFHPGFDSAWRDRCFRVLDNLARGDVLRNLIALGLGIGLLSLAARRRPPADRSARARRWLALFLGTAAVHTGLAVSGFMYRHESYVVALGCAAVIAAGLDLAPLWSPAGRPGRAAGVLAVCLLVLAPAGPNLWRHPRQMVLGAGNVHEQQCQMGRFIDRYYRDRTVAVNDIGCVSYLARRTRLLDLLGLATHEVARARLERRYDRSLIESVSRPAALVLVYESWFAELRPPSWRKIAAWTIPRNVVCARPTVAFFSPARERDGEIFREVAEFSRELPAEVEVRYDLPPEEAARYGAPAGR